MATANVTLPRPGGRHRAPGRAPARGAWAWLAPLAYVLAFGAQTDAKPKKAAPSAPGTNNALAGLTEALSRALEPFSTPPPPRRRRVRAWLAGWRDQQTRIMRLMEVREWCKTISLMVGSATFLYVCWALVDWIPA